MSEEFVITKKELLAHMERDWTALQTFLKGLSPQQMTEIQNPDGWTLKDHVAHLTAWEESVIAMLKSEPRHTGLGVPENVYLNENVDVINDVIFKNRRSIPLDEVLATFEAKHAALLVLIDPLSDEDLNKPYAHYLPDEPGRAAGVPAISYVYGNTADHFREHQVWMEAML